MTINPLRLVLMPTFRTDKFGHDVDSFFAGAGAAGLLSVLAGALSVFFSPPLGRILLCAFLVGVTPVVRDVETRAFEDQSRAGAEEAFYLSLPPLLLLAVVPSDKS